MDAQKYIGFMDIKFNKSFISENARIDQTIEGIKMLNLDILFLQGANKEIADAF